MNWTQETVDAINARLKQNSKSAKERGGLIKPKAKVAKAKPKGETANRITANVIRVINSRPGCVAYRVNNVGVWDAAKGIHRRGNTEKGLPDVWACVRGGLVTIEVKAGSDKLSEDQKKRKFEIERAGGVFIEARSTDGFIVEFEALLKKLT